MIQQEIRTEHVLQLEKLASMWPNVDLRRRQWWGHLDEDRLILCCAVGHVYADLVFPGVHFDNSDRKRRTEIFATLSGHAQESLGWLWWVRERLAHFGAGSNEVHHLSPMPGYVDVHVDENDIGWPGASAVFYPTAPDSISVTHGIGQNHGLTDVWFTRSWTTIDKNLDTRQTVAAQAFCACLRAHMAAAGRSVTSRTSIYSVVEMMCSSRAGGFEVFRPDEELAWVMFLNKRQR